MLVSIITVCYNSEATIEKTIQSVLAQSYKNFEHIIIDGGSTDRTIEILNSYKEQYGERLKIYVGKDQGIYDAMNKGILNASGEIIGIINSDDWYDPTALENVVETYLRGENRMVVITGHLVRTTINGEYLFTQKHNQNSINTPALVRGMPLQHPAVFVSKDVYELIGTFDINYKYIADYDFIWRCYASNKVTFLFSDTVTSYMREGGASDTFKWKHISKRTSERYRLRKQYIGRFKAAVSCVKFLLIEVAKQSTKRILPKQIKDKYYSLKHR